MEMTRRKGELMHASSKIKEDSWLWYIELPL